MGASFDTIWDNAKKLSERERLDLSRRLLESLTETAISRQKHAAEEIDLFFGGWKDDDRSTDTIISQIRSSRTQNAYSSR